MSKLSCEQLFLTEAAKTLLDNEEHSPFLNLSRYQLWDLGDVDALQLARRLVSRVVDKIALLQSFDFIFTGYQYSVLCLCDGSFRLGLYGDLGMYGGLNFAEAIASAKYGLQASAESCSLGQVIALPEAIALNLLSQIAVAKPPHRLENLSPNSAALATIEGISILIWRHQLLSEAVVELHPLAPDTEVIDLEAICKEKLQAAIG